MTEYSIDETTSIRFHVNHRIDKDEIDIYVVKDHIFRRSDTQMIIRDRCYSEAMTPTGELKRYNEFEVIEPSVVFPGIIAYELVRAGYTEPIEEALREVVKGVIDG